MRSAAALLLDVLLVLAIGIILFILLTGGGTYLVGHTRIGLRSPDNIIIAAALLLLARYGIRDGAPLLGVTRWPVTQVAGAADRLLRVLPDWTGRVREDTARRLVLALIAGCLVVKLAYAAAHPGFYSGDDLEIHEMTLGLLFHQPWPIWDLRSPIFPIGFIYPAQRAAFALGVRETAVLVIAGRAVVAVVSSAAVWLVWVAGRRLWPRAPGYALIAAALWATAKLPMAFGSSELPRPVSTAFVLVAFVLLLPRRTGAGDSPSSPGTARLIAASVALAVASCLRFSECVFLVPAAAHLLVERRWQQAAGLIACTVLVIVALLGWSDWWYWGEAFHSVRAAIDFTLVRRLSSRGYQPAWWYVGAIGQWTTVAVLGLAVAGAKAQWRPAIWAGLPLLVMSALPHKEAGYLLPITPYVALLAAAGIERAAQAASGSRAPRWLGAAIAAGLILGLMHDAGHYRLPRSNDEVRLARRLAADPAAPHTLVAEQLWRLGGVLSFPGRQLIDLDPGQMADEGYLAGRLVGDAWVVVTARSLANAAVRAALERGGYAPAWSDEAAGYALWRPAPRQAQ